MSEIAPIQMDAYGVVTFEKQETQVIQSSIPEKGPVGSLPGRVGSGEDQVSLSRPMKKYLHKKKSYFKQASLTPSQLAEENQPKRSGPNQII